MDKCTDGVECSRKVVSWREVAGAIRSLVNAKDLQLEILLVPVEGGEISY